MATQIKNSRKFESMLYQSATCNGNIGNWKERHMSAVNFPVRFEEPIVNLIKGWLIYADEHQARYESRIGDDGVLGRYWEDIGDSLRGLLNGDCGRLDCGTLDGLILNAMLEAGIETEDK